MNDAYGADGAAKQSLNGIHRRRMPRHTSLHLVCVPELHE